MFINNTHQANQLEQTYHAYLQRLVFLLSKRLIWNIKDEKFDSHRWETTFRKLYKNMNIFEKAKEFTPKYSEILRELADTLGIVTDDNWDMESLSRMSSVSVSRFGRRPSFNSTTIRNIMTSIGSKELDSNVSVNASVEEPKKKWPFLISGYNEPKINAVLEKAVNSSVNYSKPPTARNEDSVLAEIRNPCNLSMNTDNRGVFPSKTLKTELSKTSARPGTTQRSERATSKKRSNTPQLYFQGAFDTSFAMESPKKKTISSSRKSRNLIRSKENRPQSGVGFKPRDLNLNLSINKNDESLLGQEPSATDFSQFNATVTQGPLFVLDESREFYALKPPRGRMLFEQTMRSFKSNGGESFGSGQFKSLPIKRSIDSQVRNSKSGFAPGGDNPIKVVHNIQTIKSVYGDMFTDQIRQECGYWDK